MWEHVFGLFHTKVCSTRLQEEAILRRSFISRDSCAIHVNVNTLKKYSKEIF